MTIILSINRRQARKVDNGMGDSKYSTDDEFIEGRQFVKTIHKVGADKEDKSRGNNSEKF